MLKKLVIIFALLNTSITYSKSFNSHELLALTTEYLHTRAHAEEINAIAVSAQTAEKLTYSVYANVMNQSPTINARSLFQTGSLTKSFIAAILLQLEDDPRYHFNINQYITDFFPEYKNWHAISIKNLLNMTSGIPDFLDNKIFFKSLANHPHQPQSIHTWLRIMHERNLLFKPGSAFNYSNTNYFILGLLIEKITHHTLKFEIEHRLLKPLKLTNTFYLDNNINKNLKHRMIHGYQFQDEYNPFIPLHTDITYYNMSYAGPAAGIVSTSQDILKWVRALFTPAKVLSPQQLLKLTTFVSEKTGKNIQFLSPQDPQAFGLGIRAIYYPLSKERYAYAYEGLTLGYRAMYVYSPADKIVVTATVNSNYHHKNNYLFQLINTIFEKINTTA